MKLSYLIRTNSLDTDDRFLKTLRFLTDAGADCDIHAVVKRRSSGFSARAQSMLWLRNRFPDGRFVTLKYIEMLIRSAIYMITNPRRRWFANFDFLPLHIVSATFSSQQQRPIWDLHEMPPAAIGRNSVLKRIFEWLLRHSDVIVCNDARRKALEEIFDVDLSNALVLRNLPDKQTCQRLHSTRINHLKETEEVIDAHTVLIVGGDMPGRYVKESLDVLAEIKSSTVPDLRVRIVGGDVPKVLPSFVEATGRIPFTELVDLSTSGGISLCFYDLSSINNLLCEPNRFFQALVAGQHVIAFEHPSLVGFNYPWHWIINQNEFNTALHKTLVDILPDIKSAAKRCEWSNTADSPDLDFDAQYPAFEQWLLQKPVTSPDNTQLETLK